MSFGDNTNSRGEEDDAFTAADAAYYSSQGASMTAWGSDETWSDPLKDGTKGKGGGGNKKGGGDKSKGKDMKKK